MNPIVGIALGLLSIFAAFSLEENQDEANRNNGGHRGGGDPAGEPGAGGPKRNRTGSLNREHEKHAHSSRRGSRDNRRREPDGTSKPGSDERITDGETTQEEEEPDEEATATAEEERPVPQATEEGLVDEHQEDDRVVEGSRETDPEAGVEEAGSRETDTARA